MAKIDLKKTSGFPLTYDGSSLLSDVISFKKEIEVSVNKIRPQLLNRELTCPDIFYSKYIKLDHDGIYKSKNLRINFYLIKPNLAGIEYVKTKATLNATHPTILEVVHGGGLVIVQEYSSSRGGDVMISRVKKLQKVIVPKGYSAVIVNTRQFPLIVSEVMHVDAKQEYVLDDMTGMAYYVIRKNAKQEIVRNPKYRLVNEHRKINWDNVYQEKHITIKTPIVKQILRKYDRFEWMFEEEPISL